MKLNNNSFECYFSQMTFGNSVFAQKPFASLFDWETILIEIQNAMQFIDNREPNVSYEHIYYQQLNRFYVYDMNTHMDYS